MLVGIFFSLNFIMINRRRGSFFIRDTYNSGKKGGWYKIADLVRKRDNNKCVFCGAEAREVHHLIPLSRGGTTTMTNLVCVCKKCHEKRHNHLYKKRKI